MTFNVDHTKLDKGIYLNSTKPIGDIYVVDTYDIRVCKPYVDEVLPNHVMHTIEHILAVYLDEEFYYQNSLIRLYFGPMGCQTGFYLLVSHAKNLEYSCDKVLHLIKNAVSRALLDKVVPYTKKEECGNNRTLGYTTNAEEVLHTIYNLCNHLGKYTYIKEEVYEPNTLDTNEVLVDIFNPLSGYVEYNSSNQVSGDHGLYVSNNSEDKYAVYEGHATLDDVTKCIKCKSRNLATDACRRLVTCLDCGYIVHFK